MKKRHAFAQASVQLRLLFCLFAGMLLSAVTVSAMPLPENDGHKHMGVATCASSICHGAMMPSDASNVMKNEYVIWSRHDRHAKAYQTLLSDESKRIAKNLGLKNAHEAKVCLDCHADNVPAEMRGEKFLLRDGVGCESCHGGSEQWLSAHTEKNASHEHNLELGLYPTSDPIARAKLCLSCHYGNADKMATHDIMGAGHPRMSFELDTFTEIQPSHFKQDADYKARKGAYSHTTVWIYGMIAQAQNAVEVMTTKFKHQKGLFPELSLYDCHSCHHSMNDKRWKKTADLAFIPTGTVRLNDASLLMAEAIAISVDINLCRQLSELRRGLQVAALKDREKAIDILHRLDGLLDSLAAKATKVSWTSGHQRKILMSLLDDGKNDYFRDYIRAEQATMAIDLLAMDLGIKDKVQSQLDKMYQIVSDDEAFEPELFARHLQQMLNKVKSL